MYWEGKVANNDFEISGVEEMSFEARTISRMPKSRREQADLSLTSTLCLRSDPVLAIFSGVEGRYWSEFEMEALHERRLW